MPPDDDTTQGGSGDKGSQGDSGKTTQQNGDASGSKGGSAQSGDTKQTQGGGDTKPQYVTPTALQGVLDAQKRTFSTELKKTQDNIASLQSSIDELKKSLVAGKQSDDTKGGKPKTEAEQQIIALQRQVDELKETARTADERASKAEQERRDSEFKTAVTQALIDAGCEKPDAAFLVIREHLQTDDTTGNIFSRVKSQYGEEDLDLKTFIEREFKEKILPHVFKGKMRLGSAAGGDSGGAGGSFEFTKDQAFDAETYMKDPDKMRKAIESGKVKGIKRGSATAEAGAGS